MRSAASLRSRWSRRSAALLAAVALGACSKPPPRLTIAEVVADPARFEEQTVELEGRASDAVGIFSTGMYKLSDDTGEIWVLTTDGLPADGSRFRVRGAVLTGFTFSGRRYGTALNEAEREYADQP